MICGTKRKVKILQVIMVLKYGGSEKLASFLACSVDRSRFDTSVLALYGGGALSKELQEKSVPYYFFQPTSSLDEKYGLQRKLFKFICQIRPDIIQVHGSYALTRILPVATITNTKLIYTVHSKYTLQTIPRLRIMVRMGSVFCDRIVAVSNQLRLFLEKETWCKKRRIIVIHNGVDLIKFSPRDIDGQLPESGFPSPCITRIGVIGRLTEAKDHAGLLKAWANVSRLHPASKLVLIGDGELREHLETLSENLRIASHIQFMGDRNDIPEIISQMDLMVLPSKREGFPISILESMAMKKPVIATNVGGVPEIIDHGFNGYMVPAQNPKALANAILHFFGHRDDFSRMAKNGYLTVKEKFSSSVLLKRYEDLYHEVYSG